MHTMRKIIKLIPGARPAASAFRRSVLVLTRLVAGPSQAELAKQYDLETFEVIARVLLPGSSAIDVGANKGEILAHIVRCAPLGQHWAFEPVPSLAAHLKDRYPMVSVLPYALAEISGRTRFYVAKHDQAYSSLENRDPALLNRIGLHDTSMEVIDAEVRGLDDVIPESALITLIKIDVEGAEVRTIAGALGTIDRCKPIVLFEAGYYTEDRARELFEMFRSCGLHVSLMSRWLCRKPSPQSFGEFLKIAKRHYFFIAHP